jgi:TMEM199 family protein
MADPSLTVSLEPHLVDHLRAVLPVLPKDHGLSERLVVVTREPLPSSVSYSLLSDLSRWTRTPSGTAALKDASLDEHDYSMVSLLAGTRAAPEKHFPTPAGGWPTPAELRAQDARRDVSDRQALAHVVNALISIGGAAVAVWYAAGVAGWKNEWVSLSPIARMPYVYLHS